MTANPEPAMFKGQILGRSTWRLAEHNRSIGYSRDGDAIRTRVAPVKPLDMKRPFVIAAVLAAAPIVGCSSGEIDDPRPLVVCTTTMIGDLATEIAGEDLRVEVLLGPEVDPHLFRPTRDDVARLLAADVVLWNGFHLESNLQETLERLEDEGKTVVPVGERATPPALVLEVDEGTADPHVWMDVSIWARAAATTGEVLLEAAPTDATSAITERTKHLVQSLVELDEEIALAFEGIPSNARTLVTAHDAFSYFGRRYGFRVHAIQGISTSSEAGLRAIEELVALVVERQIPAVFFESSVSERSVRALVEGAHAEGHAVSLGGTLHADAPGDAGNYIGMVRHNASALAAALAPDPADVESLR